MSDPFATARQTAACRPHGSLGSSGGRLSGLGSAVVVCFSLAFASQAGATEPAKTAITPVARIDSVDALFSLLARSPGLFAHFHEEKRIALLVAPLQSDGTIHFDRRHGLARHTLSPQRQSVLLSGATLTIWDGEKTEAVPLQSSAPLRALAESFSLLLAADRAGLEKSFTLAFRTDAVGWRLALVPTLADLKKLVTEVDVAGEGLTPRTLVVHEASGDESTTTLADVDLGKRYSDAEAAGIFRAPLPGRLASFPAALNSRS